MGTGKVVFEKDQKQRKIKYKKFTDDGVKKLHEARFAPLPTGDPQTWADQVPVKRDQVMKNLYMALVYFLWGKGGGTQANKVTRRELVSGFMS